MRKPKSEQGRLNIKKAQNREETKKKKSESISVAQTRLWQDPKYRESQLILISKGMERLNSQCGKREKDSGHK